MRSRQRFDPVPHELSGSKQDETFTRQFFHYVAGAERDHGQRVAEECAAYLARMKRETGWSTVGCFVRLIEMWGMENAR